MLRKIVFCFIISTIFGSSIFFINQYSGKEKIITSYSVAYKSIDDLINESELIIKGNVVGKSKSKYSNPNFLKGDYIRNILQTDIYIKPKKVYKGIPYNEELINLRIDRGENESTIVISEDFPEYSLNDEYILFLSKDTSDVAVPEENYYVITGYTQGVLKKVNETDYKKFISLNDKDFITEYTLEKIKN